MSAGAASATAAAAAESMPPYQWQLPRMGDMPENAPPSLRLPPLPPGSSFEQQYEVSTPCHSWIVKVQASCVFSSPGSLFERQYEVLSVFEQQCSHG